MIKHPVLGTLDEFLAKIKTSVERGVSMSSAGLHLSWYAQQYADALRPAEPGAPIQPPNSLTLQQIDELRELNARGEHKQVAARLEELAREHGTQNR